MASFRPLCGLGLRHRRTGKCAGKAGIWPLHLARQTSIACVWSFPVFVLVLVLSSGSSTLVPRHRWLLSGSTRLALVPQYRWLSASSTRLVLAPRRQLLSGLALVGTCLTAGHPRVALVHPHCWAPMLRVGPEVHGAGGVWTFDGHSGDDFGTISISLATSLPCLSCLFKYLYFLLAQRDTTDYGSAGGLVWFGVLLVCGLENGVILRTVLSANVYAHQRHQRRVCT